MIAKRVFQICIRGCNFHFRPYEKKVLNSDGQQLNSEGQQFNSNGQQLNSEGQQLNSDGQQLNQYQQNKQPHLTSNTQKIPHHMQTEIEYWISDGNTDINIKKPAWIHKYEQQH